MSGKDVVSAEEYVFDSSTLILLAKITVLRRFAETHVIIITEKVKEEVLRKKDLEDACIMRKLIEDKLIKLHVGKVASSGLAVDFAVGYGEAETMQFALHNKKVVATDDWRAIRACKILNIKFITAIHCLIALYEHGCGAADLVLEKLKALEKYGRYNAEIIKDARARMKGEQNG